MLQDGRVSRELRNYDRSSIFLPNDRHSRSRKTRLTSYYAVTRTRYRIAGETRNGQGPRENSAPNSLVHNWCIVRETAFVLLSVSIPANEKAASRLNSRIQDSRVPRVRRARYSRSTSTRNIVDCSRCELSNGARARARASKQRISDRLGATIRSTYVAFSRKHGMEMREWEDNHVITDRVEQ